MKEIWKNIEGFNGDYEVSNLGRIKSLKGDKEKILTNEYYTHDGYRMVTLSLKGKWKPYRVHRLVAKAFIPNPNNYPQVNHINEDKTDNRADNLEWCTAKYNILFSNNIEKMNKKTRKRVVQTDNKGNFIALYVSVSEAGRQTGINFKNISACCLGKRKNAGGYIWNYE